MADFIIHCPKCNHAFEPGDSIREEVQNELRGQMKEWQKQKEIEKNKSYPFINQKTPLRDKAFRQ